MENNTQTMKNAIQTFEQRTASEMIQQMSAGASMTTAVTHLRSCLTGSSESRVRPSDAVRAADYAEQHGISTEEAFHAIAVSKQAKVLRKSGMPPLEVLSLLTSRIGDQLESSPQYIPSSLVHKTEMETTCSSSSPPPNLPTSPSSNVITDSSGTVMQMHDSQSRVRSSMSHNPPSPSFMTSPPVLPTNNRSRALGKKTVAVGDVVGPSLKRSRSSDHPIVTVKEVQENNVEIDLELGRLLTNLSSEINEAMRLGDRSQVALLMRQRDQLRLSRQAGTNNKTNSNNNEVLNDSDTKRTRPSSRTSY